VKFWNHRTAAFSLVEVTLALGLAAFCLLAIFGLLPVGVQTNRNATSQTAMAGIIAAVIADLRATPKTSTTSSQFGITFGTAKTLYFNGAGQVATSISSDSRYRLGISFPSTGGLTYANLKVTWPAPVDPAVTTPAGSAEMFAAFDRN
jgi:uncharacterized protein (TIGR02598 family)